MLFQFIDGSVFIGLCLVLRRGVGARVGEEHTLQDVNHRGVERAALCLEDKLEHFECADTHDLLPMSECEDAEPEQLRQDAKKGRERVIVDEDLGCELHLSWDVSLCESDNSGKCLNLLIELRFK